MNYSSKRKVAKEIMILFISVGVILLLWWFFWIKNEFQISKEISLQERIITVTKNIDSLQSSFPKAKSFEEMLISKNISIDVYNAFLKSPDGIPTPEDVLGSDLEKTTVKNLRKLFILLENLHYPFDVSPFNKYDSPTFYDFKKHISTDFKKNLSEEKELKNIYSFLIDKKCLNLKFEEFVFNLEGLPLPPPHNTWIAYEKDKKDIDDLKSELTETSSKIYSVNELKDTRRIICIIILVVVYPIRFLSLVLIWAIKILRQKQA